MEYLKNHQFQALSGDKNISILNHHLWVFWSAMFTSWSLIPYFCHLMGKFQFLDLRLCDSNGTSSKNLLPNGGELMVMNLMARHNNKSPWNPDWWFFWDPYIQFAYERNPIYNPFTGGQCQRLGGIPPIVSLRFPPEPRTCELRPRESAKYLGRKPTKHRKGWKVKVGTRQQNSGLHYTSFK